MGRILSVFFGLVLASAGALLLFWILWLLWKRSEAEKETPAIEIGAGPEPERVAEAEEPVLETQMEVEEPVVEAKAEAKPAKADDLKRIEGIGPKISSVLAEAGITTFSQLADTDVDQLRKVLEEADPRLLRLVDPTAWPEQASLAAAGEWEALEALQGELKRARQAQ